MRVISAEFKKIFSFKSVAVAVAVFILFVLLWDCWRINPLPYNGEWEVDIVKLYGPVLTPEEAENALEEYIPSLQKEADEAVASVELLKRIGVENHEDYYFYFLNGPFDLKCRGEFSPEYYPELTPEEFEAEYGMSYEEFMQPATADELEAYEKYYSEWSDEFIGGELNSLVRKIYSFKGQVEYAYNGKDRVRDVMVSAKNEDEAEKARVAAIFDTDEYYNVSYDNAFYKIKTVANELPVIMMAVMLILLAPVLTRDNMTGVSYLQYSSKCGRRIITKQLFAILLAGIAVSVFMSSLWALRLIAEMPKEIFATGLNGFNTVHEAFWLDSTVGGFAAIVFAMVIAVAAGFGLMLFCASLTSRNYIQLLIKIIPVAVVYIGFFFVFGDSFFMIDHYTLNLYDIFGIPYAELIVCAVLAVVPAVISAILIARYKGREAE